MAWTRVALLHAAGEKEESLQKSAALFGYQFDDKRLPLRKKKADASQLDQTLKVDLDVTRPKESPRPPSRFLRVKKFIEHDSSDSPRPKYLNDPAMRLTGEVAGSYRFPDAQPLMPSSRLLPFLLTNLGGQQKSKRLNHQLITKVLGQGKALPRLPYLSATRWPKRLQVIVDSSRHLEPYWFDFECVVADLKRQLGEHSLTVITLDEDTLDQTTPSCLKWPIDEDDGEKDWEPPSNDQPVLILSDLGMSHPRKSHRVLWRRFGQRHLRTAKVLTLSPACRSPVSDSAVNNFKPNPFWGQSLPKYAYQSGFDKAVATSEKLQQVLTLLSALPLVDVALLRKLRVKLAWGGSELEGQIWNHRDTISTGLGICVDPAILGPYRERYKRLYANTQEARVLWETVTKHHKDGYEGLKNFESYSRATLENHTDTSGLDYIRQLAASIEQADDGSEQHQGLVAQCRSILSFCPDSLENSELSDLAHELLTVAYREEIERQDWQAIPLANARLEKMQSILAPETSSHHSWQLVQTGGQGEALLTQSHDISDFYATYTKQFKAPTNLPVTIREQPRLPPREVGIESALEVGDDEIIIENGYSTLVVDAITKPSWAVSIGSGRDGLWSEFLWSNGTLKAHWRLNNGIGEWQCKKGFGIDEYGLYADLEIAPQITQRFRWIPPGTFLMGSPETEPERYNDENLHEVTLSTGYWLADTTVTQEQWQAITGENPSHFKGESLPVEQVSWDDSQRFIQQLNKKHEPLSFQLPTEAQWEYACRAGTSTPFSFGENITPEQVNYNGDHPYNEGETGEYREKTIPVKSLPCNGWGLHEMHGNVWEWCQDQWQENLGKEPLTDPKYEQDEKGAERVVRGGSWNYGGRGARSACRDHYSPDFRIDLLGLRLSLGQPSGSSRGGSR